MTARAILFLGGLAMTALGAAPEDATRAVAPARTPLFGFVSVGGPTGDDRGPAAAVMAAQGCASARMLTIVGSNWRAAQLKDPGQNWQTYDWSWFERDVAPYRGCDLVRVSYCTVDHPRWIADPYGSERFWERAEDFLREFFTRCTTEDIFYHIFENEPDGLAGTYPDRWMDLYLERLRHAHKVAKEVDPRHQLIGGNMFTTRAYADFYEKGFGVLCDVVGFHNYSDNPHTGNDLEAVVRLHEIMEQHGDGAKPVFLGEGWGPGRELSAVTRTGPNVPPAPIELRDLREYLLNGYRNLTTRTERFDPAWILGAYFFTLNDNYGGFGWQDRAVPQHDESGRLLYYKVDGYNVGKNIEPRFYNGGLATFSGTSKDTLLDLFPGDGVTLANPGFEYEERDGAPYGWETLGDAFVDRGMARTGVCSLRLEGGRRRFAGVEQALPDTVLAKARAGVRLVAYGAALDATDAKAVRFSLVCDDVVFASAQLSAATSWQRIELAAVPPAGARSLAVRIAHLGRGPAWIDDVFLVPAAAGESASVRAFVYDPAHAPIADATITILGLDGPAPDARPAAPGEQRLAGLPPGVYDLRCEAPGQESRTVSQVVLQPGGERIVGFELRPADELAPLHVEAVDARTGGAVRLSWDWPASIDAAQIHVHRSEALKELGERIASVTDGTEYIDRGLENDRRYFYTLLSADGDGNDLLARREAQRRTVAVSPTYGEPVVPYDVHDDADWDAAREFAQTFVATDDCTLISARCIPAAADPMLTFEVRVGSPTGEVVGPARTVSGTRDHWVAAQWAAGEVELVKGATYCLAIRAPDPWSIYHTRGDRYAEGQLWLDGVPAQERTKSGNSVDMWSTIRCARAPEVYIHDVRLVPVGPTSVRIDWRTRLPTMSVVAFGPDRVLTRSVTLPGQPARSHSYHLRDLNPGLRYCFRIRAVWDGRVTEITPYYWFEIPRE